MIYISVSDPVPVVLYGEGNYALTDIKEIKVTEEFLGLDPTITDCESQQFRTDCRAAEYQERIATSCSCAPLNLKHFFSHQVRPPTPPPSSFISLSRPLSVYTRRLTVWQMLVWRETVWRNVRD